MIGGRRPLTGRKPGDRRVRVERPHAAYFRYTGPNQLVAKPAASLPRTALGRGLQRSKSWLIGRPLASEEEIGERLSKRLALPIFSSDAISSSAYATEEILRVLVVGGALAFVATIQVATAIAVMLAVVAISYRQVCRAFPNGGGAYAVARQERDNNNFAPRFSFAYSPHFWKSFLGENKTVVRGGFAESWIAVRFADLDPRLGCRAGRLRMVERVSLRRICRRRGWF